ncbi:hypothetical protein ACVWZ4_000776 [Bradyrhizobium sp. USDA 4472]
MRDKDGYRDKEVQKRFEAVLRGALKTSQKPPMEKPKSRAAKPPRAPAQKPARNPR